MQRRSALRRIAYAPFPPSAARVDPQALIRLLLRRLLHIRLNRLRRFRATETRLFWLVRIAGSLFCACGAKTTRGCSEGLTTAAGSESAPVSE
jgi:hypothetical protein